VLELERLTIQAGTFSVTKIDLTIQPGCCHVLVGPTGCGKTTLLEAIVGIRRPHSGVIRLEGRDITDLPIERRGIAYLPQDLALFPHLSVEDNIFYGIKQQKGLNEARGNFVLQLTQELGISHLLNRGIGNLSGGERQRVALVRALAPGSRYLLLDEPFSALHEAIRRDIWQLILELKRQLGLTIVMISHDLKEAFFLGDEISVMVEGKPLQTDKKEILYERPKSAAVAAFLGLKNLFPARILYVQDQEVIITLQDMPQKLILFFKQTRDMSELAPNSPVLIGIRSEHVMLLRPGMANKHQKNLITGVIEDVFFQGKDYTAIFRPDGSFITIRIDVPGYAASKLSLKRGDSATICMCPERLFLLSE